jgi:hypothetical protein
MINRVPNVAPINFQQAYLNKQIHLIVVDEIWPLKTDAPLDILLESNTTNKIVFPSNYNLRIFYHENGKWIEIPERPTTTFFDQVVMTPEEPLSYQQIVGFWPQYPDPNQAYYLRVYVFGDMTTPDGTQEVAAFVDFVVTP